MTLRLRSASIMPPIKNPPETVAAVDLGSNSFHLIVVRIIDSRIHVLDRLKEMVRFGAGLDADNNLTPDACRRALDCLRRFGERVRKMPREAVRAVGTNTLRKARNANAFLVQAHAALGHSIEIISGIEEARLIYLGVSHSVANSVGRRLVVDIGGGSTELIIGEGFEPLHMESLYVGCIGMTQSFFADGKLTAENWRRATIAARLEMRPVAHFYRHVGWDASIGASGTLLAVAKVAREMGLSPDGITLDAVQEIRRALFKAGHMDKLNLPGLTKDRVPVFPGGLAVLQAIMEGLKIDRMAVSDGALREGLVYDLLGRIRHEDVRARTIEGLARRFQIDVEHTRRVQKTALWLFEQVTDVWQLDEIYADTLAWAARLHEIGLAIAHNQYHKHGAYLIENADMHGFSRQEQQILALLVRAHRRKFPLVLFRQLPEEQCQAIMRLSIVLRLAVLLHRTRETRDDLKLQSVRAHDAGLELIFAAHTLEQHPLTQADLEAERTYFQAGGFELTFH
jgi:exopolyphosphatase/guanosine-5'-triphosphate,3'-diphosphate pyrophosphatase